MPSIPSALGGIAGNAAGEAVAFGLGFALGRVLEPEGVGLAQVAWEAAPIRAPDAANMALGVAQGQVTYADAAKWAKQHGYDTPQFDAMVNVANVGPPIGYAFQAWRRGELSDDEFTTALRRTGLETQWNGAMRSLKEDRLDLGAIATAVHRGILAAQGLLVREPPVGTGAIERVPVSTLSATDEAAAHGIDSERLRVLIGNTGLPLALGEMLRLLNMGHVTEDDVRVAVAESNIRNEYMDAALLLRRRLLTPHEYAEAELRGLRTTTERDQGAALSGMEPADTQLLFELLGRPLNVHEITTARERGGKFGGDYATVPEPYQDAIRRSAIRPEYADLAYANRYTYPSAFVLRSLAQTGDLPAAEVEPTLLRIGWEPTFAAKVAKAWTGGTSAKADPHVTKAESQLWTALHRAYINDEAADTLARTTLTAVGVPDTSQSEVLTLWGHERALIRAQLTPGQIKKAIGQPGKDQAWAMARLEELGYSTDDATALLAE